MPGPEDYGRARDDTYTSRTYDRTAPNLNRPRQRSTSISRALDTQKAPQQTGKGSPLTSRVRNTESNIRDLIKYWERKEEHWKRKERDAMKHINHWKGELGCNELITAKTMAKYTTMQEDNSVWKNFEPIEADAAKQYAAIFNTRKGT